VIASVDTYLRFAEAVNRLDIQPQKQPEGLPGLIGDLQEGGARHKTRGALSGVKETAKEAVSALRGGDEDEDESSRGDGGRSRSSEHRSRRPAPAGRRSSRREEG
jgi:hypothetical protein